MDDVYSKSAYPGTTGVLLVDKIGLPIESSGNLQNQQSGLISSIMKNALKIERILNKSTAEDGENENAN